MNPEKVDAAQGRPRRRVLLCAYAISPYLGSEYGISWNFVTGLAKHHDLTVLYGSSGHRMGNVAEMEEYLGRVGPGNVDYVYVKPNRLVLALDWLNHHVNTIFFPWSHKLWLKQVEGVARKLARTERYDPVHQQGPIGFRNPGFLWKIGLPFVWGPVGGTASMAWSLFPAMGMKGRIRNLVRNLSNVWFLRFSPGVRRPAKAAAAVFCATDADRDNFRRYIGVDSDVVRENAILELAQAPRPTRSPLRLVWAGSVDDRKALTLLVQALAKVDRPDKWQLDVVGDGPQRAACTALAQAAGIDGSIRWHGRVPRTEVLAAMGQADVHVLTSLMDSNPTVLLEAFEACIPTIALHHCGMGEMITPETGIRIEIGSLAQIVDDLAVALRRCIDDPGMVDAMKSRIHAIQGSLHWDENIRKTCDIYERALARG